MKKSQLREQKTLKILNAAQAGVEFEPLLNSDHDFRRACLTCYVNEKRATTSSPSRSSVSEKPREL